MRAPVPQTPRYQCLLSVLLTPRCPPLHATAPGWSAGAAGTTGRCWGGMQIRQVWAHLTRLSQGQHWCIAYKSIKKGSARKVFLLASAGS